MPKSPRREPTGIKILPIEQPVEQLAEQRFSRYDVEQQLGLTPYMLRKYLGVLRDEAVSQGEDFTGYTQEGKAGYISPDLLQQLQTRVEASPEEAPVDGYSTSALQHALECGLEKLGNVMDTCPSSKQDRYGLKRAANGYVTEHYTPAFLGKIRIALAGEEAMTALFQDHASLNALYDNRYVSKAELAKTVGVPTSRLAKLIEQTPAYRDEMDAPGKLQLYAMRYGARLRLADQAGIEFKPPVTEHERLRSNLLRSIERLNNRLGAVETIMQTIQPLPPTISARFETYQTSLQDHKTYISGTKLLEDLQADWFVQDFDSIVQQVGELEREVTAFYNTELTTQLRQQCNQTLLQVDKELEKLFYPIVPLPAGLPELRHQARELRQRFNETYSVIFTPDQSTTTVPKSIMINFEADVIAAEKIMDDFEHLKE